MKFQVTTCHGWVEVVDNVDLIHVVDGSIVYFIDKDGELLAAHPRFEAIRRVEP